jgi:hypothetical protein
MLKQASPGRTAATKESPEFEGRTDNRTALRDDHATVRVDPLMSTAAGLIAHCAEVLHCSRERRHHVLTMPLPRDLG